MDQACFTPIAEILVTGYLETRSHSRQFQDQWGSPPTILAKVHHLRSIVQAQVAASDGFLLGDRYIEFGRVEITDLATERHYLLKSENSLAVEQNVRQREWLFDANDYLHSAVLMLVYGFGQEGVTLSLTGAVQRSGSQRLYASGSPAVIHTWAYDTGQPSPFDQDDARGAFEDLGNLDMDDEDEELA